MIFDVDEEVRRAAREIVRREAAQPGHIVDEPKQDCRAELDEPVNPTDLGNAQRLVARHGRDLRYCHPWGKWLIWDGTRWATDDTAEIERRAKETIRAMYAEAAALPVKDRKELVAHALKSESEQRINAMIKVAKSEPGIPVVPDDLDQHPYLLNCLNGTLDLKTGILRPHQRADLITKIVPIKYDPNAKAQVFYQFLAKIMEDNWDLITFLQRAFGYALTGDCGEQVMFILHGNGANGKSTLLNFFLSLLGDYAMQTPTETLMVKKFGEGIPNDLARLKGARLVTAVEVEQGRKLAESKVKAMTGQDPITARFMRAEFFEFIPEFKLFLACNHKPVIRGTDEGIWRRIRLIPFTVAISKEEQDPNLPQKLRAEAEGVLAWAVQGCLDWQKNNLGAPTDVTQATKAYRAESDIIGDFLGECCEEAQDARAAATPLYRVYQWWCSRNSENPLSQRLFGVTLTERGFERSRGDSSGRKVYLGIRIRQEVLNELNDPEPIFGITRESGVQAVHPEKKGQTEPSSFSKGSEKEKEWVI